MGRGDIVDWIARYEQRWRLGGDLADLFTPDATYRVSPWAAPLVGLDPIRRLWRTGDGDGDGDGDFTMTSEIVAVEGSTGIVRVAVDYVSGERWRDLWVVSLDADGLCSAFEEWPFAPDQQDGQHDLG